MQSPLLEFARHIRSASRLASPRKQGKLIWSWVLSLGVVALLAGTLRGSKTASPLPPAAAQLGAGVAVAGPAAVAAFAAPAHEPLSFDVRHCQGIYLDVGTNIGVQIRKLYDPEQFPAATIKPVFDRIFGNGTRQGICTIGFEPNARHAAYLKSLEANLRCRGFPTHIFTNTAVSTEDGPLKFYKDLEAEEDKNEWGASLLDYQNNGDKAAITVTGVNLAAFLWREIYLPLGKASVPIVMKLDIEGAEYEVVPHLISTGALCGISFAGLEWHPSMRRELESKLLSESDIDKFINRTATCGTELLAMDDEAYGTDGLKMPLPACTASP